VIELKSPNELLTSHEIGCNWWWNRFCWKCQEWYLKRNK